MSTTHEEKKVLGRQVNSGIDYSALKREQSCPVIPIHLSSFRQEKGMTVLMTGHPYWQFFESGAFEFKGKEIGITTAIGREFPEWSPKKSLDFMKINGISKAITSIKGVKK
jgi:hypothetical protein